MQESETIFTSVPMVGPGGGIPMPPNREYTVPKKFAEYKYQRGYAQPAARFYLEGLRRLGVTQIAVGKDADPSVANVAKHLGVKCTVDRSRK